MKTMNDEIRTKNSGERSSFFVLRSSFSAFSFWHELVLALLLLGLLIAAHQIEPRFLTTRAQLSLSSHIWELAILALPMTLIIITAGIDLSVGSTMALAAVILGICYEHHITLPAACGFALITGLAAGLLNGIFVAYLRVHPLIVTLATFSAYRGIAEGVSLARPISGFPQSFRAISANFAGLPIPGLLFAILAILTAIFLHKTPWGRFLYAIGYNETATRFSGAPVQKIKLALYSFAGLLAALSAIFYVALRNTAKADIGTGMELDVITAVVLGGTSIFGGRGNILGTLLGVLLIHETREFVSWHWQNDELISIVIGGLLIISVLLNTALSPRKR